LVGFTEALLTDIFVIGARFKDFKRRHQSDGVE
jgi:hypothetical protein